MTKPLTPRQQRFVEEYLIDLNATQAAIRAGYSKHTAQMQSSRLLSKAMVIDAVRAGAIALRERAEIKADSVVAEFAKIGFADARDYFKWGPNGVALVDSSTLTPAQTAVVAEASQTKSKDGGTIRIKLHDKLNALDKLAKHLGLYDDRPQVNQNLQINIKFPDG